MPACARQAARGGHVAPGPIPISAHVATVDVAHSRAPRIGGNRGIMRNSIVRSGHGRVPICADPLIAHGSPTATHHAHHGKPVIPTKPATAPQRPHPPMCNTQDTHTHQARHTPHNQPTTNSNRNTTDLDAEMYRSRHGLRPISAGRGRALSWRLVRTLLQAQGGPRGDGQVGRQHEQRADGRVHDHEQHGEEQP